MAKWTKNKDLSRINKGKRLGRMIRVSDRGLRGPGLHTSESQTLFRIFDGCRDYSTHDMSDFNRDCKMSDGQMQ